MSEPAPSVALSAQLASEEAGGEIARYFGISRATADRIVRAGYPSVEAVRALSDGELSGLGIPTKEIDQIRASLAPPEGETPPAKGAVDGSRILERWLESVKKPERPKRRVVAPPKDSTDILRKWVQGDDAVLEAWIRQSEPARPTAPAAAAPTTVFAPPAAGEGAPAFPPALVEREETVVRWLTGLLDRVKTEEFEPSQLLQEVQELQRQLYDERQSRKQREEELEHVKRGSIAVIKYVRTREAKEREEMLQQKEAEIADLKLKLFEAQGHPAALAADGVGPLPAAEGAAAAGVTEAQLREIEGRLRGEFAEREHSFIERETELRRRIIQLEGEVRNYRSQSEANDRREKLARLEEGELAKETTDRLRLADSRERELVVRENELRTKFEEIRLRAEDLERKREPILYKEKELQNWEQELRVRQQALEVEGRRIEQARIAGGSPESVDALKRLKDLQGEIAKKEEEIRARERFLHQKMEELEGLERKAAEGEAEQIHTDIVGQAAQNKLKSGVRRLDDLLFGGYPGGTQVLVNGPAHTGKDVLARLFVAEGLRQDIPVIWVVTDKTYLTIREEMSAILPSYSECESRGLVRYVDLYSRSLGVQEAEPIVTLLSSTDNGVLERITQSVLEYGQELKERSGGYRLVFESVSTLTAYIDSATAFRFLQPFAGRRKLDRAVAYYLLETGMHSESDLQTLEHMMDGSLNLKVDQLKTYLSVHGITDVQSRAWVGYTFTKKTFNLGSFSLDHIR